jgi:hypothetical protein
MGSVCQNLSGALVCTPTTNSCECAQSRVGFERSCFVSSNMATCVGRQTCEASGSYSVCDTSTTSIELCDGADNDCDGVSDDGFFNTRDSGTYDTDEQCGSCQTNCRARWSPTIQHAIGGCRVDGGVRCGIAQCTIEPIFGAGQECRTDAECGEGVCDPVQRVCLRSCSRGCLGGTQCIGTSCAAPCTNDRDCAAQGPLPMSCQAFDGGVKVCARVVSFNDVDQDETNGCECPRVPGAIDEPDVSAKYPVAGLPYVDRDCDGIDGVAASSIFVWAQSPSSQGTRENPFRTIREALAVVSAVRNTILVAQGTYVEQVLLVPGVRLHGGYAPDFKRRDVVTFPTLIEAPQPDFADPLYRRGTVNAEWSSMPNNPTVFAGFTVRGYDVTTRAAPGQHGFSSYAVYVNNAGGLALQNNHFVGGRGGDAAPAAQGGAGASGGNGADGLMARECATPTCVNETQVGGAGGTNGACAGTTNGNAGAGVDPRNNPQQYGASGVGNGQGGSNGIYSNANGGQTNLCKYDCIVPAEGLNGRPATNGADGASGRPGAGCTMAMGGLMGADWVSAGGQPGAPGSPGRGGGGGGGGGCVRNDNSQACTVGRRVGDLGATGGGGGAGGCGGSAGSGAGSGGGSFAVFVVMGTPRVQGNLIDLGFGGTGGNGGFGGYGGLGGQGGRGGLQSSAAWCAGQGGQGGRGGNGGAGSGGGGGCGGASVGVGGRVTTSSLIDNTFAPTPMNAAGSGGLGGASPAGAAFRGGDGRGGLVQQVVVF